MASTDPSGEIQAQLTDMARNLIARATLGQVVFKVMGFGLGRGGYDPNNVVKALPLVPTDLELTDKVFPSSIPYSFEPFISTEEPTYTVRVYNCRVGASILAGAADYGLGELGLYGKILKSEVPSEVGSVFLYAMAHFPIICKTRRDTFLRRVVVSF